ncbi:hypothetical protein IWZ01DRAFT_207237 [Phyllosticta capitalensis]
MSVAKKPSLAVVLFLTPFLPPLSTNVCLATDGLVVHLWTAPTRYPPARSLETLTNCKLLGYPSSTSSKLRVVVGIALPNVCKQWLNAGEAMRACMHAFVAGAMGGVCVLLLLLLFLLHCSWMLASPAANLLVLVLLWQQATTASETGLTVFFPWYACFLHKAKTTTSPSTS